LAWPLLSPRPVSFECGVDQCGIESCIGLPKPLHYLRQIKKSPSCRLFKESNRANHREPALNCCEAPGTVIHQDSSRFDFLREANGFQLAGIHVQREA
jgi:hypothetical protein